MSHLALIVIDMQKAYFQDPVLQEQQARLVRGCNELIEVAIRQRIPIWNIVTEHAEDKSTWSLNMMEDDQGFLFQGSDEVGVVEDLKISDARTIIKTRDSAFFGTSLINELEAAGVTTLILCGVSTQSCVMQTAADAYAHDLRVLFAEEAIGTNHPDAHEFALALLEREYRQTRASNDELSAIMSGED